MAPASRRFAFAFVVLVVLVPLVCAEGGSDDDSVCKGDGPKDEGCPLQGNSDFYGLGVRVGICTSLVSSLCSSPVPHAALRTTLR
jgi:hypothetical protein